MRTLIAAGAATFLIGGLICVGFVLWWLGQPTQCASYAPLTSQITDPANLPTISLCPGSDESPTLYLIAGPLASAAVGALTGFVVWRSGVQLSRTR